MSPYLPEIYSFGQQSWAAFKSEEIPDETLSLRAKYFVFNTQGVEVESIRGGTSYASNNNLRSFFCTCERCSRFHHKFKWKISFTRVKNQSTWKLSPDYLIADASRHRIEVFNIRTPSFLANFMLFQDFILNTVFKVKLKRPTTLVKPREWSYRSIREDFLRAHTHVSITTKSKAAQVEKKLDQIVMYATRSIISYYSKTLINETDPPSYIRLASYAKLLDSKNPLATVVLQADNQSRFYRFFLGLPIATPSFLSSLTFPVFVADCSYYKEPTYDGHLFALVTKTSYNDVILLAFAVIPSETKDHLYWVLEMCLRHGIPIDRHALFTDEGPLLATLSYYKRTRNMHFFPNICTEHFLRNIFKKVGKPDMTLRDDLRKFIYEASQAEVYEDYRSALQSINITLLGRFEEKPSTSYGTMVYILSRHPKTWTVFANSRSFQLHTLERQDSYFLLLQNTYRVLWEVFQTLEDIPIVSTSEVQGFFRDAVRCHVSKTPKFKFTAFSPDPCRRFGFATTNAAEQMANVFKVARARSVPPPESIKILVQKYNEQCQVLREKAINTTASTHDEAFLTPPGLSVKSMWSLQRHNERMESSPRVLSEEILDNGVTVSLQLPCETDHHFSTLKWLPSAQGSDLPSHSFHFCCDRHITTSQMFTCPCPCYKIVLDKAKSHPNCPPTLLEHGFEKHMYPSFYDSIHVRRKLTSSKDSIFLDVPSGSETKNFIHEIPLLKPTKYRLGCSGKDERIPSRGEVPSRLRGKRKGSRGKAHRKKSSLYSPTSSKRANELLHLDNYYTNPSDKSLRIGGVFAVSRLLKGGGNPRVRENTDMTEDIEVAAPSSLVGGRYLVLTPSEEHELPQACAEGIEDIEGIEDNEEGINHEDDRSIEQNIHLLHGPTIEQQLHHIGDCYRDHAQAIRDAYLLSLDMGDLDDDRLADPEDLESNLDSTLLSSDEQSGNPYIVVSPPENPNDTTYQEYLHVADTERSVFLSDKYQELLRSNDDDVVEDKFLSKIGYEDNPIGDSIVQKTDTPFDGLTGPDDIGFISDLLHTKMTKMSDFEDEGNKILTTFHGTKMRSNPMRIDYFDQLMKTLNHSCDWLRSGLVDDYIRIMTQTIKNDFVQIYYCLDWQNQLQDVTEEADGVEFVVSRFNEDKFLASQKNTEYTLFDQDLVLVPMTDRKYMRDTVSHFFLCIIVPAETTVLIYDSLWDGPNSSRSANPIRKYEKQPEIEMFLKSKEKLDKTHNREWAFRPFHGTVQRNSCDCGVFALASILALYNNFDRSVSLYRRLEPLRRFYADDYYITKFRYCAFYSILSGSLIYPKASKATPLKRVRANSTLQTTETRRKNCTTPLIERIKLCRLPTTEKANSPAKRGSKFVTVDELKSWLKIHGIRYMSSDLMPALMEKSLKATTNYDLVINTLKESWTSGREALLEREELITKMNNLKSSKSKDEKMFLSTWSKNMNHDLGLKYVGTVCASGKGCFFSSRCITGDLKGQCPRCENPVHDTVCLDSIRGICLQCVKKDGTAPTTPSKRLFRPAGITPSPVSTSQARDDALAGGDNKEDNFDDNSGKVEVEDKADDCTNDSVEISDSDKKLPAKQSTGDTHVEDKKTTLQALQSIVDRRRKQGKEEAQMPQQKGRMLRIGDEGSSSTSDSSSDGKGNVRAGGGDSQHLSDGDLDGYHSPDGYQSPPFDVSFVPSLSPPNSPLETNGETEDGGGDVGSVGSGSTTMSERKRRYEKIDDTLTVGDSISFEKHCNYTSGIITGWLNESGTYRPFLQSEDPFKVIPEYSQLQLKDATDHKDAAVVYKKSSEARYFRSGKKCCHYTMNVNEAEDDILYLEPGTIEEHIASQKADILSEGAQTHCPVVKNNQADNAECRIRISKHFKKQSRNRTKKLFDMLNDHCFTKRNAAAALLGRTSVSAVFTKEKTEKGTFVCTNCREEYEIDGPYYYTCKCQFHLPRYTYCSHCMNDEGCVDKKRARDITKKSTGDLKTTRKTERQSPVTKKMQAYRKQIKKRKSPPPSSAKKNKKRRV